MAHSQTLYNIHYHECQQEFGQQDRSSGRFRHSGSSYEHLPLLIHHSSFLLRNRRRRTDNRQSFSSPLVEQLQVLQYLREEFLVVLPRYRHTFLGYA